MPSPYYKISWNGKTDIIVTQHYCTNSCSYISIPLLIKYVIIPLVKKNYRYREIIILRPNLHLWAHQTGDVKKKKKHKTLIPLWFHYISLFLWVMIIYCVDVPNLYSNYNNELWVKGHCVLEYFLTSCPLLCFLQPPSGPKMLSLTTSWQCLENMWLKWCPNTSSRSRSVHVSAMSPELVLAFSYCL